jgi:hypothetical protein
MQNRSCSTAKKNRPRFHFPGKRPDFRESSRVIGIVIIFQQNNRKMLQFYFSGKMNKKMERTGQRYGRFSWVRTALEMVSSVKEIPA